MNQEIATFTGRMPFSGRTLVREWFFDGIKGARNGNNTKKVGRALALLGFSALHAIQLKIGFNELINNNTDTVVETGIDAGYTAANAMVTYSQAYLGAKILKTQPRQVHGLEPTSRVSGIVQPSSTYPTPEIEARLAQSQESLLSSKRSFIDLAATIGGQAAFLSTADPQNLSIF